MKYDVFISYSRKDYVDEAGNIIKGNIVTQIKELLTSNGYTYWFDETGIYSGDEFVGVITEAIQDSEIFLFISSVNSNKSEWTNHEIAVAKMLKKKTIPFKVDTTIYNTSILMYLAPLDFIDYQKNPIKAFEALIASLKNHFGKLEEQQKLRQEEEIRRQKELEVAEAKLKEEEAKNKRLDAIDHEIAELRVVLDKKTSEKISVQSNIDQLKKKINDCLSEVKSIDDDISTIHTSIGHLNKEKDSLLGKTFVNVEVNHKIESGNMNLMVKGLYLLIGIVAFVLACYFVYNGFKLGYTSAITANLAFAFSSFMSIIGVIRILMNYRDGLVWMMIAIGCLNLLEWVTLIWTKAFGLVHFSKMMDVDRIKIIGCSIVVCIVLALPLFVRWGGKPNLWSQMQKSSSSLRYDKLRLIFVVLTVLMFMAMIYNRVWPFIRNIV